jgi:hypothetical protein
MGCPGLWCDAMRFAGRGPRRRRAERAPGRCRASGRLLGDQGPVDCFSIDDGRICFPPYFLWLSSKNSTAPAQAAMKIVAWVMIPAPYRAQPCPVTPLLKAPSTGGKRHAPPTFSSEISVLCSTFQKEAFRPGGRRAFRIDGPAAAGGVIVEPKRPRALSRTESRPPLSPCCPAGWITPKRPFLDTPGALGPASKKSSLVLPPSGLPSPNSSSHRPVMAIGVPSAWSSCPR